MLILFIILLLLTELTSAGGLTDDMALSGTTIVKLPDSFPRSSYTPYGYIDNPYHSMILNRSGVIRSVPPLGFGYWKYSGVGFSFKYFLPRENSLACLVEIENLSDSEKDIVIHATNIYGLWENKWWGSDGLSAEYLKARDVSISKIWALQD